MAPAEGRVRTEPDGPSCWLILDNPARHNALSLAMWQSIPPALRAAEADPALRVILLRGAGEKAFAAGADISQFEAERAAPEAVLLYDQAVAAALHALSTCTKPTIAMIRGYCFGGGLALALACDLRLAATDARFAIPAAKLGLGYALDGLKTLYDLVGPATAKEMLFTARQFSAEEAVALGLINRLVDVAALEALARDYGTMIASNAPLSIAAAKTALAEFGRLDGPPDRARCEALIERCFQSQDYVEGRRAFVEKRAPRFRGC